jgi:hypothetical protein
MASMPAAIRLIDPPSGSQFVLGGSQGSVIGKASKRKHSIAEPISATRDENL